MLLRLLLLRPPCKVTFPFFFLNLLDLRFPPCPCAGAGAVDPGAFDPGSVDPAAGRSAGPACGGDILFDELDSGDGFFLLPKKLENLERKPLALRVTLSLVFLIPFVLLFIAAAIFG